MHLTINTLSDNLELSKKTIFVRLDLNLPLDPITKKYDQSRLKKTIDTIFFINQRSNNTAKIILSSHFSRPTFPITQSQKQKYSLEPIAKILFDYLDNELVLVDDYLENPPAKLFSQLPNNSIIMLENLRFYREETQNHPNLSQTLAKGLDYYINDAFSASHRSHSSIVGLPKMLGKNRCFAGKLMEKEFSWLTKLISTPSFLFLVVIGGSKVKTKSQALLSLITKASGVFITGAMSFPFLKLKGFDLGDHQISDYELEIAKIILRQAKEANIKIYLPEDHLVTIIKDPDKVFENTKIICTNDPNIKSGYYAFDIGIKTRKLFKDTIGEYKTILWNGPCGYIENPLFRTGSDYVAKELSKLNNDNHQTIVGGGDTLSIINRLKIEDQFSYVSCGGGAMLEFFAHTTLPGLEPLYRILPGIN